MNQWQADMGLWMWVLILQKMIARGWTGLWKLLLRGTNSSQTSQIMIKSSYSLMQSEQVQVTLLQERKVKKIVEIIELKTEWKVVKT